jgi:branched-chain amino acid aminotransferase
LERVVFLGGSFVDAAEARVALLDRGYLVGEGAFATMRAYRGRCFRAARHLAQLARAAAAFGLDVPADVAGRADEAAARAGGDARVRVTVSETAFSIVAEPIQLPSESEYMHGVACITASRRRIPPACAAADKTLSYAPQMLAQREARAAGAFEAIQLALDGTIACGSVSNLFLVLGDELATPPLDTGCRPGITREAVLDLAPQIGLRPCERHLSLDELRASEAFLTSSRIELLPIASLDGTPIRRDEFVHTHALHHAFRELVARELGLAP